MENGLTQISNRLLAGVALFTGFLAAGVMGAWYAGWIWLIQPVAGAGLMMFNTALSIALLSLAVLCLAGGKRRVAAGIAVLPLLICLASLLETAIPLGLGLDEFFVEAYVTHPTAPPGRTAPNTAVALILASVSLFLLSKSPPQLRAAVSAQIFSVAGLALATTALIGHALSLEPLSGWYGITHMAPHSAGAIAVLSLMLLLLGRSQLVYMGCDLRGHAAGMAVSVGLVFTLSVWQAVHAERIQKWEMIVRAETEGIRDRAEIRWRVRLERVAELAPRLSQGGDDTVLLPKKMEGLPGLMALVRCTPDFEIEKVLMGERRILTQRLAQLFSQSSLHEVAREAVHQAESRFVPAFTETAETNRVLASVTPSFAGEEVDGYVIAVYDVTDTLNDFITPLERERFSVRVLQNGSEIFATSHESASLMTGLRHVVPLQSRGLNWRVEATPTEAYFEQTLSGLAEAILLLGGLMTLALGWSLHERGRAFRLAEEQGRTSDALSREIDHRREVEEALREREEHIRTLLQSTAEAIYGIDTDGRCTFCNVACIHMLGYQDESELLGQHMHETIHHHRADGSVLANEACKIYQAFRRGAGAHVDTEVFWRADGSSFPVEYWSHPIYQENEIVGAVVAFMDVSVRKAAEEALRLSEERLDLAARGASDGLWDWEIESNTVWYSDRYRELLGFHSAKDFPDSFRSTERLLHPKDLPVLRNAIERHIKHYDPYDVECRLRMPDGTYRWFRSRAQCIRTADGRAIRMAGSLQDVTARREMVRELNTLNRRLVEHTKELERRSQEVEAFVYIVSHDLRAPLVNIQGFCLELEYSCRDLDELLEKSDMASEVADGIRRIVDKDIRGALHYITAGTSRYERLIDALLALSRTGRQSYLPVALNMKEMIADLVASLEKNIEHAGAVVSVEALPDAYGDRTAIEQVFSNLIVNALNYLRPDVPGEIVIGGRIDKDTGGTIYWVKDNGSGIPAASLERVFEVFQRAHADRSEGEGMGLAIVKRIVERHGGEVRVESEENVGTTFYVSLPQQSEVVEVPDLMEELNVANRT